MPGRPDSLRAMLPDRVRGAGAQARRMAVGAGTRARRGVRPGRLVPGLLSVVVPCYNVEEYLDECLVSLRFQHYRRIEIIVVDDGSPDRSREIARAHQRRDLRIRVVRRDNGGLGAARNTGVEHARGEFLAFIDSDDVVSPEAFSAPIAAMAESGSDVAVTNYDRLEEGGRHSPAGPWIRRAHARRRLATTLEEFPEVMVNAVAWSKVYRRAFWDEAGLAFPVRKLYEDQAVSMAAFAAARTFDVLPQVGVSWRIRGDRSSISQGAASARNLADHNDAVRASLRVLREHGHEQAAQLRVLQLLAHNLPFFTRNLLSADDDFWAVLRVAIEELAHGIPADLYRRQVNAQDKVLYELIAAGRREDAAAFLEAGGADVRRFRTRLDASHDPERTPRVLVELPFADDLPAGTTALADAQLELVHRVMNVHWLEDGALELRGWAFIRLIDLADHPPTVEIALVGDGGARIDLAVETRCEPGLDEVSGHWYADYRNGGWTARLDAGRVPTAGRWTLEIAVEAAGIRRSADVDYLSPAGAADLARSRVTAPGRVVTVAPRPRPGRQRLELVVHEAQPYASEAERRDAELASIADLPVATGWEVTDDTVTITVRGGPQEGVTPVLAGDDATVTGRREPDLEGHARLVLPLTRSVGGHDGLALPTGTYAVRLEPAAGSPLRSPVPVTPHPDVLHRLPASVSTARHRAVVEVVTGRPTTLALRLAVPLPEDARGPRNQVRLRAAARVEVADETAVLFRSPGGAVDEELQAVHRELRARGAELALLWSVRDHAVPVPDGGIAVVEGTWEWHRAIARSRYHLTTDHQPPWFTKPDGQVLVVAPGHPEAMGHARWSASGFTGPQIASLERRTRAWDYLLSPSAHATSLLRTALLEPAGAAPVVLELAAPEDGDAAARVVDAVFVPRGDAPPRP